MCLNIEHLQYNKCTACCVTSETLSPAAKVSHSCSYQHDLLSASYQQLIGGCGGSYDPSKRGSEVQRFESRSRVDIFSNDLFSTRSVYKIVEQ